MSQQDGVTISQLPRAGELRSTDYIEIEREGASYSVTAAEFMDFLGFDDFIQALSDAIG